MFGFFSRAHIICSESLFTGWHIWAMMQLLCQDICSYWKLHYHYVIIQVFTPTVSLLGELYCGKLFFMFVFCTTRSPEGLSTATKPRNKWDWNCNVDHWTQPRSFVTWTWTTGHQKKSHAKRNFMSLSACLKCLYMHSKGMQRSCSYIISRGHTGRWKRCGLLGIPIVLSIHLCKQSEEI